MVECERDLFCRAGCVVDSLWNTNIILGKCYARWVRDSIGHLDRGTRSKVLLSRIIEQTILRPWTIDVLCYNDSSVVVCPVVEGV